MVPAGFSTQDVLTQERAKSKEGLFLAREGFFPGKDLP
jgi:hypothetical protein